MMAKRRGLLQSGLAMGLGLGTVGLAWSQAAGRKIALGQSAPLTGAAIDLVTNRPDGKVVR